MKGYTTIEQSKHLVVLGLDPSTADMCYPHFIRHGADTYNEIPEIAEDINYPYEMPCWSLTALLELIPLYTLEQTTDGKVIAVSEIGQYSKCSEACDNPIDAAFEIVCWLIEQKHIKVNK